MTQLIATPQIEQKTNKISYQTFLQTYNNIHAEWIDGKVITLMTASDRHQDLVRWLIAILSLFVEKYDLGWLRPAPFNMNMPHLKRGREPDILFVHKDRLDIVNPTYLSDAADLVVEIISPESIGRDRGDKFVEYEAAGVREYWLIDPERNQAEFYELADTGRYRFIMPTNKDIFNSLVLPKFWLDVNWLWQYPLPKILEVARKLDLL